MKNKIQLITYVDRIGCANLSDLKNLIANEFKGLFGGVHLLPFFYPIDGADAGFDPIDHTTVDSRIGDWGQVKQLATEVEVMSDLIVNHISAQSIEFKDYLTKGKSSDYADLILTKDKIFSKAASNEVLTQIYRPRPGSPFTTFQLSDGSKELVWTTFTSNQIDIDVNSKLGAAYLENILNTFQKAGISMVRLDAAGYAIKKEGTSCFMIEETYDFIAQLTRKAKTKGIEVLVEIHSFYKTQIEIAKRVDYVYDFALPVLVLDCLYNNDASRLKNWLKIAPRNVITVLDTHDGIGIVDVAAEGDEPGLIPNDTLNSIVENIHLKSGGSSRKATGAAASNLDLYQVNCTYFDALGRDQQAYLIARAIQFFVPGIPQIYYVGLMAGTNDMQLLAKTRVGRDINRHYYSIQEIRDYIKTPFFKKLQRLMLFRNSHNAFNGQFRVLESEDKKLCLNWINGTESTSLTLNLEELSFDISFSDENDEQTHLF